MSIFAVGKYLAFMSFSVLNCVGIKDKKEKCRNSVKIKEKQELAVGGKNRHEAWNCGTSKCWKEYII